jgi:hypothetical protein
MSNTALSLVDRFENTLNSAPATPSYTGLRNWIVETLRWLAKQVFAGLEDLTVAHDELADRVDRLAQAPPPTAPATTPASQPQRPPTRQRCQRCHALGHDTTECRTKDPAMTKKRIAKNAKDKARARLPAPAPPPHNAAFAYPYAPYAPHIAPQPSDTYAALIADATEMRRRAAQSSRDKRIRRRAPAVTATTT